MALIIDGKKIAKAIREELKGDVELLVSEGITPGLSVVLVGEDPASQIYVRSKTKACAEAGIHSETIRLSSDISQPKLLEVIQGLNSDPAVHAILLQLPLPKHIDEQSVINSITPEKDVDGFHYINRGMLLVGEDTFVPCTPLGIQQLLIRSEIPIVRQHVVIVGRSHIVGLPLASILVQKKADANATVTICHTGTKELAYHTKQADILVAAVGRAQTIKEGMVKEGAVVIDVGVNRLDDPTSEKGYRIVGDVDFYAVAEKVKAITPVPGGVGPMTIAMLLKNTVKAAKQFAPVAQ